MSALEELGDALRDALAAGTPPPCAGRHEWLSERPTARRRAAALCAGCVIFTQCGALADQMPARFGVWAGRDRGGRNPA